MLGQEALIHLLTRAYPRQNKVEKYKKIGLTINLKGKSENPGQSIVFNIKKSPSGTQPTGSNRHRGNTESVIILIAV